MHAAQVPGCSLRAQSQVDCVSHVLPRSKPLRFSGVLGVHSLRWCHASLQESWYQALTHLTDMNYPGFQEDMISDWKPALSLGGNVVSGVDIAKAPCLPPLAVTHLPLLLQRGRAIKDSSLALLWYSLGCGSSFCGCTRDHNAVLEPSCGKVCLFFFDFWCSHYFGCSVTLDPPECSQGIQPQSLPPRTVDTAHISTLTHLSLVGVRPEHASLLL